jgi:hypothetical protein
VAPQDLTALQTMPVKGQAAPQATTIPGNQATTSVGTSGTSPTTSQDAAQKGVDNAVGTTPQSSTDSGQQDSKGKQKSTADDQLTQQGQVADLTAKHRLDEAERVANNASLFPAIHRTRTDGDCLFDAVVQSADLQGVDLPVADPSVRSVRDYTSAVALDNPELFDSVVDRDVAQILVADATAAQLRQLLPGFTPPALNPQIRARLITSETHRLLRQEAERRYGPHQRDFPIVVIELALEDFTPTVSTQRLKQLEERVQDAAWRDELARRIQFDPASTVDALFASFVATSAMGPGSLAANVAGAIAQHGWLPTGADLIAAGLAQTLLWNSAIGDDIPRALAVALGVNIVVVEGSHVEQLLPGASTTLYVRRVGAHYEALGPPRPSGKQSN